MNATQRDIRITHADRLGVTLFLAISLHALVILGISFSSNEPTKPNNVTTMDITLVQQKAEKKPEKADYLAQADQHGSGNTKERVAHQAEQSKPAIAETKGAADQQQTASRKKQQTQTNTTLMTSKKSAKKVSIAKSPVVSRQTEKIDRRELIRRSKQIARLSAQNDANWQAYSELPDSKYLYANTRHHADAAYLAAWARKVKQIGEMNYPYEARRKQLSGSLMMEVAIKPDGALESTRIIKSSGHKVLDKAAISIVKLAAPYSRVPPEVLGDHKVLRIIRTLSFTVDNRLNSR